VDGDEILLYGDEQGVASVAARLGVRHRPDLRLSEYGTPLIGDVFARAQRDARTDWLCYVNADVIAMSDLARAVATVARRRRPLLMSGRRWRLEVLEQLEFGPGWEERWPERVRREGRRDSVMCMDYFVFPRGLFDDLPDFAIGRGRWDSYLPWRAREQGADFIDASEAVLVAHQDHAFAHPDGKAGMRHSPEGVRNGKLAMGGKATLGDATHKLSAGGVRRAHDGVRLRWWLWTHRDDPVVGWPVRRMLEGDKERKKRLVR